MEMGVALLVMVVLMVGAAWSHGTSIFNGCQIRGVRADCSRLRLQSVPEYLPVTITSLDLSYNEISSIQREHLSALLQLKSLNVAFNQISSIDPWVFLNNSALEDIDLSNNRLPGAWDDSFAVLKSVRSLDVRNNSYNSLHIPGSFTSLKTLYHLKVGGANVTEMYQSVSKTMELEHLSIVTGDLTIYTRGSLSAFHSLKSVTLALTMHTNIELLTDIICDVSCNSVELQLEFLNFTDYSRDVNPFQCISKPQSMVEVLTISHTCVEDSAAKFLVNEVIESTKLRCLNLRHIEYEGYGYFALKDSLKSAPNVRHIFIENFNIKVFNSFYALLNLKPFLINVQSLVLNFVHLYYFPCEVLSGLTSIVTLDISGNLLTEYTSFLTCSNVRLPYLMELIFRKNHLTHIQNVGAMLISCPSLKLLDVSENQIVSEWSSNCKWPSNLQVFNISSNLLTDDVFDCLPTSLQSLDVSNNKIQNVNNKLMKFKNLKELHLSNNKINTIPVELLQALPWLKVLTIAGNILWTVEPSVLHHLGNLTLLDMRGNPFYCTCNIRHFVTFCENSSPLRIEGWPAEYHCSNPENEVGKQLSSVSYPTLYCDTTMKSVIACVTTFVCTALLVGLCWYLDALWYVRMTWAWLQAKRRNFLADPDENSVYDAFVSYSQQDAAWVMQQLMPELESHSVPPFRLCVHERDFIPGRHIMDNIIDCIELSRKTLFIISQSFVESEWCHYELYFAQQRLIESRDDALVLVLLEPIPHNSVPSRFCRLRCLMKRKTYLEWPAHRGKQALFWANLRATLGRQKQQEPKNEAIALAPP
ncbi:toll-like receptor 2 [Petromyzon marinus]|uniref:Toll-like receptor 2 n=1 Tax=Petromyzon marinus TaxID=7757 RepID=A0AAJ7UGF8_PETMA|nr:toll-like receptor 2 [Petromyzon marinus]XP_032835901.1 toll-like receptor 2 [Petromyzon marinus]XP_032835902.1 toll-like receptor 2 [Petromyzon marinus]XP_032835903.1 toll-like receptor 2 [Petromyzon marinus]